MQEVTLPGHPVEILKTSIIFMHLISFIDIDRMPIHLMIMTITKRLRRDFEAEFRHHGQSQ